MPDRPGLPALDLSSMDELLLEVKAAYPHFKLWIEPGRFIVAEAGALLARVT